MCNKKVTESARNRHWKQTFPPEVAVLKILLQSKTDMFSPWQSGFHILVWMFVRSQAVFLHTQSQTAPTFPGDKEEDVVMRLTIHLPVIYGVGNGKKRRQKKCEETDRMKGEEGGEGKCLSLNTTPVSLRESQCYASEIQQRQQTNVKLLVLWTVVIIITHTVSRSIFIGQSQNEIQKAEPKWNLVDVVKWNHWENGPYQFIQS